MGFIHGFSQNAYTVWILDIGNELYQKLVDDHEREQQQNVTEVERRAWRLASEEKARALKEAKEAAEMELEKAMAAAKKAQVNILQNLT